VQHALRRNPLIKIKRKLAQGFIGKAPKTLNPGTGPVTAPISMSIMAPGW
jgi:hypothetical protein